MAKSTIAFKKPSGKKSAAQTADDWVATRGEGTGKMKRFTIDVSEALHARIKVDCASRGAKMSDVIREMLEERFPVKS